MSKTRNSSLDLLRILCMVMVVSLHYIGWGGLTHSAEATVFNKLIGQSISLFSKCCVNCFFILSGFFLSISGDTSITKDSIFKKALPLWWKLLICSVGIYLIAGFVNIVSFNLKDFIYYLVPFYHNIYWFGTIFLSLILFRPFLSRLLSILSRKEFSLLLIILLCLDTIPTLLGSNPFSEIGYGLLHGFTMLLLGVGMNLLPSLNFSRMHSAILYLVSSILAGLITILIRRSGNYNFNTLVLYNSPFIVFSSIGLFNFFRSFVFHSICISKIAPHIFTVYLINDHPIMREYGWEQIFHCSIFHKSNFMILHFAFTLIVFFALGVIIDILISKLGSDFISLYKRKLVVK